MGVTLRRRQSDLERLRNLAAANPGRVEVIDGADGASDLVRIRLHCRSMTSLESGMNPTFGSSHLVRIQFGHRYPLEAPLVYIESPIAHPHIFANTRRICLGPVWSASETLDRFVDRIWSILTWQPELIDPNDAANYAANAWYEANRHRAPLDPRTLRIPDTAVGEQKPRISWLT